MGGGCDVCVCGGRGRRGGWLNSRVVRTLSFHPIVANMAKEEVAKPVVGNDSDTCEASFAGDVPRIFSLIKNEGDP